MLNSVNQLLVVAAVMAFVFLTPPLDIAAKGQEWKSSEVIRPEQLAKMLSGKSKQKPLVLQVGFEFLYHDGHISGSEWAGPASQQDGLNRLTNAVKNVPKNREIILYCGCCPWSECPNIRPAFETLEKLGFSNVKVMYVHTNFGQDWIDRGFPVTKGNKP
ncbi:MAG: rhodanese-like domain-containing protein [Bacteroidetes bacterium]|nr:rhodanese-like domain-containing protein [Bacteroidota bacterium]